MRQKIPKRYLRIRVRIPKFEIWQELFGGVFKGQLSVVDTHQRQHGRERFGRRSDSEKRVGSNRHLSLKIFNAKSFDVNDAIVFDDNERYSRNTKLLTLIVDRFFDCA